MGIVIKLSGNGGADRDPRRPEPRPEPKPALGALAGIQRTPALAAGIAAALLVLVVGLWLAFGRGNSAASTPMMDTTSESNMGITPDSQRANGMDTGTGSGKPAALNNGMSTGTGR